MIIVFFLISFILCCHSATPICPKSFSCPNLSPFKYPFYNATDTSSCGLIRVNCTRYGGEIQLGKRLYPIANKLDSSSSIFISNTTFEQFVKNRSCEALMNNFTSPSPLLFSIKIQHPITIFKCRKDYSQGMDAYFVQHNYYNKTCRNHNFYYYKHPINDTRVLSDLPDSCLVIELPVKEAWQDAHELPRNLTNVFSLLSSNFAISFPLSATCDECVKNGSYCNATQNGHIQCFVPPEKQELILVVLLSVALLVALLVALFVAALCGVMAIFRIIGLCFKRIFGIFRKKTEYNINVEIFLKNHEFLAPTRYSYSQLKKMTNSFEVKLGQGSFGCVYKGALSNGNLVAVKILCQLKGTGDDFINEVASVGNTCHVNIVNLVGFCLEGSRRALIYEFMPNGSLERFIYSRVSSSNRVNLGWEKLHQIAIGIARGLEYLHRGCNTRILHFDIKPHNILLNKDFVPKISDFGLAKLLPEKRSMISMTGMRGTPGYIAPEIFSRSFGQVSHKSDVYSYGMMILEMVGGRRNIEVEVDHTSEIYFPHWIYKKVELHHDEQLGLDGIVNEEENEMARKMIIVGLWCIQTNPLSRPTMTKVLEMLEDDIASLEIPPKPYLSSPPRSVDSPSRDLSRH